MTHEAFMASLRVIGMVDAVGVSLAAGLFLVDLVGVAIREWTKR